jgi:hypothetical protein
MDSVPLVAITGQVPTAAVGGDAFQEADITGITMPVTKHNEMVTDAERIPALHHELLDATVEDGPVIEGRALLLLFFFAVGFDARPIFSIPHLISVRVAPFRTARRHGPQSLRTPMLPR